MRSIRINVHEEATWGPAPDEDRFQWAWDVDPTPFCTSVPAATCYGPVELDDNANWATQASNFQGSFVTHMTPRIWEEDEGILQPHNGSTISPVGMWDPDVNEFVDYWNSQIWSNAGNEDDADYWYSLKYCTGHWPGDVANCQM